VFDTTSRYLKVPTETITVTTRDGQTRVITYVMRRRLPAPGSMPTLFDHIVRQGERLDNITARYLADPTQFWQVCDANVVRIPDELVTESGRSVRIPLPGLRS
jgi:hypothetical protein